MRDNVKNFIHSKFFITILILLFMGMITLVGTYAWLTWSSVDNTSLTMTIGKFADVIFDTGNDITTGLTPVYNYYDGEKTTFTINNRSTETFVYNVIFNIETIANELATNGSEVKYALVKNDVLVNGGDLSGVSNGSSINMYTSELAKSSDSFIFYLYIDGNTENDINMIGKTITGNIIVEEIEKQTLVEHITNLYNENVDEENPVTNNGIAYNYARIYAEDGSTSGGLMNDRHDSEGNLLDDANAGNIRYYGASPNNYINFNCETYPDTNCETWRIIGVFDGKVKLIRNSVLGSYSWDYKYDGSTASYSNDWSKATLNTLLNDTYYKAGSTSYYNDSITPTTVNFSSTGLKNDTTRNMISETLYYLGGWNNPSVYSDQIYEYERGTEKCSGCTYETRWPGKIALAYPSDYGYAADFGSCSQTLGSYSDSTCITVNWMKSILGTSSNGWLLTMLSSYANYAWYVYSSCDVYSSANVNFVLGVAPVLHLNSDVVIESGNGSSGNPYRISVG